jgi:hypothetical protein
MACFGAEEFSFLWPALKRRGSSFYKSLPGEEEGRETGGQERVRDRSSKAVQCSSV